MNRLRIYRKRQSSLLGSCGLNYILRVIILLCSTVLFSGCVTYYSDSIPAQDYYYISPHRSLTTLGRVALIGLNNNSNYPKISDDVTEKLYQALQKRQLFGLTVIRQDDAVWRSLKLDSQAKYTLDEIKTLRDTLKCDAILLGTITEFRPYPHMIMGLRLKLLDLKDGQLMYALEQVWDCADKTTENRMKGYFRSHKRSGYGPLKEQLASVSSLEFIKFVSYEIANTLY
jgi:hypothetical protein